MTQMHNIKTAPKTLKRFAAADDGAATVTALFVTLTALMVGGLAVDHAQGLSTKAKLQAVADAAAHAAVMQLHEGPDAARAAARQIAQAHEPGLLSDQDIRFGQWTNGRFEASDEAGEATAVALMTRRSARNENPLPTLFLKLIGVSQFEVSALSVASVSSENGPWPCSGGGFFAQERTVGNSSNNYANGFCLYGDLGVQFHNRNVFEPGTSITMPHLTDFQMHTNNPGANEALREGTHDFVLPASIPGVISGMRVGTLEDAGLPAYVTKGPVHRASISQSDSLASDTLYVVSGDVALRDPRSFENIAIVAEGNITVDSNVTFDNVILVSEGYITFNSNISFGGSETGYCDRGVYGGYIFGEQGIVFNSNNTLRGVMMASQGDIVFNSNNHATDGIYAEAGRDIVYNSRQRLRGCESGLLNELAAAGGHQPSFRYALVQ